MEFCDMKITSTRTVTVAVALAEALMEASMSLINSGGVDTLAALRNGLQDEFVRNNPR